MTSTNFTKSKKKPKGKPIKEKELKKDGDIKELEALSNLALNVRKLAKFQKQDRTNLTYPRGTRDKSSELFDIYDQLLSRLITEYKNFSTRTTKEKGEEKTKP